MSIYGFIVNGNTEKYDFNALENAPLANGTGRDSLLVVNGTDPNTSSGNVSFAAGAGTEASAYVSTAIGAFSIASGIGSFAGGRKASSIEYPTTASGEDSFAFGLSAKATGNKSVAFGQVTNALANMAFAAGNQTTASGNSSFAMGYKSIASGANSVAIGTENTASEECAVAFGQYASADGKMSVAMGDHTNATGRAAIVFGAYNIADANAEDISHGTGARKYLLTIGNGTADDARSNAMTVDWDGNIVAAGKITVGAQPTEELDVATMGIALKAFSTATTGEAPIVSISSEHAAENVPVILTCSSVSASKIYKTGVNIASGQYESGIWNASGVKEDAELAVRSKDYIPVARNTSYFIAYDTDEVTKGLTFRKYGQNKNLIGSVTITSQSRLLTTDGNCYFVTWSTDPSGDSLVGISEVVEVYEDNESISSSSSEIHYSITYPPSINYPSSDTEWHSHWEEVKDISDINTLAMSSETTNFFCDFGELSVEYRLKPKESDSEITISVSVPGNDDVVEEVVGWEDEFGVWHEVIPNTYELIPSKFYHFVPSNSNSSISSLNIVLKPPTIGMAHYHFDFDTGSTAPTVTLPATVNMPSNFYLEANKHYEIDIFNNYGTVVAWTIS